MIRARDSYRLDGAALADECRKAVLSYPPARAALKLANSHGMTAEADALTSELAAKVWERHRPIPASGHGRPADVLAYIADVERRGGRALIERHSLTIPRGAIGRRYLHRLLATILRDSRTWQDCADQHRTRTEAAKGTAARNVDSAVILDRDADSPRTIMSAAMDDVAIAAHNRNATSDAAIVPAALLDLARETATHITDERDHVARRRLTAALVQMWASVADVSPVDAMADLAADQGRSLNAVRVDASRAVMPDADALLDVAKSVLSDYRSPAATWDRVELTAAQRAAAEAVAQLSREGGSWDPASLTHGARLKWADRGSSSVPAKTTRPGQRMSVLAYMTAVERMDPADLKRRVARWEGAGADVDSSAYVPLNGQPVEGSHSEAVFA